MAIGRCMAIWLAKAAWKDKLGLRYMLFFSCQCSNAGCDLILAVILEEQETVSTSTLAISARTFFLKITDVAPKIVGNFLGVSTL